MFLSRHSALLLTHASIRQINFSLNSFNGSKKEISFEKYIDSIYDFCEGVSNRNDRFVNLRLWSGGGDEMDESFFAQIKSSIKNRFAIELDREKRTRLASRIIFDFDDYFEWPASNNKNIADSFCLALSDHFGILSNGTVVPCCLDSAGEIELGNIFNEKLEDILDSDRSKKIIEYFKKGQAVESLCQSCSYRLRFSQTAS